MRIPTSVCLMAGWCLAIYAGIVVRSDASCATDECYCASCNKFGDLCLETELTDCRLGRSNAGLAVGVAADQGQTRSRTRGSCSTECRTPEDNSIDTGKATCWGMIGQWGNYYNKTKCAAAGSS
jgi:hypothetical protein